MSDLCETSDNIASGSYGVTKKKHLSLDAKNIIKNVYCTLLEKGYDRSASFSETSILTKVALTTVKDIVTKPIQPRKKRCDSGKLRSIEEADKDLIRRKIYDMYSKQIVPTIDTLKKVLTADETDISCGRTSLWRIVKAMGFKYRTIDKRQVLMESQRLQVWRRDYLNLIRQYREENRPIIYLDETWFDTHDTPKKGWSDSTIKCQTKAPSNKGQRITILHAGSENGFIPNALLLSAKKIANSSLDYHQDTDATLFEDWFQNRLLPNVPKNSVIVMDNASYHSRQLNKVPNSNNTKVEIQNYMMENNIYFEETYRKKDLLNVLKTFNIEKEYICDNLASANGHTVLRLPPYYCIFNPIEHIWSQLKTMIRRENTSPTLSSSVIELIKKCVNNIPVETWKNSVRHVIQVEDSYNIINSNVRPLIISLGIDEDDSDSETELNIE